MSVPAETPQARRLYLHVGLQKTGTSYLQAALLASRAELAEQGVDLVPPTKRESYRLMLAVRGMYAAERDDAEDRDTLRTFSDQLSMALGDRAVYSQESLAAATPDRIERLLEACVDREVHVVLTARDLGRQLPSMWQEALKSSRAVPYPTYLNRLRAKERAGSGEPPWINADPVKVLQRWSATLHPDRVHLVTVPPRGSPTTILLERFCRVLEVDPAQLNPEGHRSNMSLGRVQAELLRRVNAALPDEVRRHDVYGGVGKRFFASQFLRTQEGRKILVPEDFRPWCDDVTGQMISALEGAGYHVVGSLDELRCSDDAFIREDVEPSDDEVASAAVQAIAGMLTRRALTDSRHRDGRVVVPAGRWERLRGKLPTWVKNPARPGVGR
jgi:hypothetical protein